MLRELDRTVEAIAVAALTASTIMISAGVVYRYAVLDWLRGAALQADWLVPVYQAASDGFAPIGATLEEVPGYLLVWIAFLGAYLALRRGGHIAVDTLVRALPKRTARALTIASDAAILVFLAVMFYQGARMIRVDGATEIETAALAQGWFMVVIPLAAVLFAVALVARMFARRR